MKADEYRLRGYLRVAIIMCFCNTTIRIIIRVAVGVAIEV